MREQESQRRVVTMPVPDPLEAARIRGVGIKSKLLDRAGGVLSTMEAAERLGVSPVAVSARRRRGHLLAVTDQAGQYLYPAFQFIGEGTLQGLAPVLRAFQVEGAWTRLSVLLSPADALNGRTPIDALRDGDTDSAVQAVSAYGEHLG